MSSKELFRILSHNTKETESAGALLASIVNSEDCFVALCGELGAGKTAFTRGFVSILVPGAEVTSPSYSVINVYENERCRIRHADVYRLTSDDDLYSCGFYDYDEGVTLVEWCDRMPYILPKEYYKVRIEKRDGIDPDLRMIVITKEYQ